MKTTLKAIWFALLDGDIKSVWKLLNVRKNNEFIACLDLLKNLKK